MKKVHEYKKKTNLLYRIKNALKPKYPKEPVINRPKISNEARREMDREALETWRGNHNYYQLEL